MTYDKAGQYIRSIEHNTEHWSEACVLLLRDVGREDNRIEHDQGTNWILQDIKHEITRIYASIINLCENAPKIGKNIKIPE